MTGKRELMKRKRKKREQGLSERVTSGVSPLVIREMETTTASCAADNSDAETYID